MYIIESLDTLLTGKKLLCTNINIPTNVSQLSVVVGTERGMRTNKIVEKRTQVNEVITEEESIVNVTSAENELVNQRLQEPKVIAIEDCEMTIIDSMKKNVVENVLVNLNVYDDISIIELVICQSDKTRQ